MPTLDTPSVPEAPLDEVVELGPDVGPESSRPRVTGSPRVLIVEDDGVLRAELAELLAGEGFDVSSAPDGAEALEHLRREPLPAVILLDLMLPRMTGVSFRLAQLASPSLSAIPSIAMTSLRETDDLADCRFAAVFTKPLDFDRLVEALTTVCTPSE